MAGVLEAAGYKTRMVFRREGARPGRGDSDYVVYIEPGAGNTRIIAEQRNVDRQ